jgi:hypothetical protein
MVRKVLSMETAHYLGMADIARQLGVTASAVTTWRNRYSGTPAPFPAPDVEIGLDRGIPGWLPGRVDEIRQWRKSLPGQGAGGGRTRRDAAG